MKSLTDGRGFDLIVELAADRNLASDLTALAKNGRVVVIGSRGKIEIDPREMMARESDILGLMLFGATPIEHRAIYTALTAGMEAGTLRPVVGLELPLAEANRAASFGHRGRTVRKNRADSVRATHHGVVAGCVVGGPMAAVTAA